MRHLWNKTRASVNGDPPPKDPKKTFTLEVRSEEVKVLYARVLALQSLVDGRLDPREIEYLYVFMSRIGLSSDSREEIRQALATSESSPADVVRLVEEVISAVPDNQDEIAASMIKDLVHLSHADNVVLPEEKASIELAAEAHFGERAPRVIELAEKTVKYEQALLDGNVSAGELGGARQGNSGGLDSREHPHHRALLQRQRRRPERGGDHLGAGSTRPGWPSGAERDGNRHRHRGRHRRDSVRRHPMGPGW